MSRATPFILLATQRSGSSWVQEMLGSHPAMRVYTELFLAESRGFPMWEPRDVEFIDSFLEPRVRWPKAVTRPYWTVRYLRQLFDRSDVSAVGFKYMYDQVRRSRAVLAYAAARRIRVIHLIRGNLLDTVISAKLAGATGLYHLAADGRPPVPWWPSKKVESVVHLEIPELVAELERLTRERRRIRAWLTATRTPIYEVQYETLAADQAAFAPVLEFLGMPGGEASLLTSGLQKLQTRAHANVVENYSQVREALALTPHRTFLEA